MSDEKEMSFLDHLEVLRWHIIRSLIAAFIFSIIAFLAKDFVFGIVIFGPSRIDFWTYNMLCQLGEQLNSSDALCVHELPYTIINRKMTGQFSMHLSSSLLIGVILAFPYIFWEIWRFVKPGLHPKERKVSRGVTFFTSLLFLTGISFGYFVVAPLAFNFLANYNVYGEIENSIDLTNYIAILSSIVLACGIMFQLPMVVYFLSKIGLVTPRLMRKYRRHSIVIILIVGALITPADLVSQLLVSFPLFFLYELSILISSFIQKKRIKQTTSEINKI